MSVFHGALQKEIGRLGSGDGSVLEISSLVDSLTDASAEFLWRLYAFQPDELFRVDKNIPYVSFREVVVFFANRPDYAISILSTESLIEAITRENIKEDVVFWQRFLHSVFNLCTGLQDPELVAAVFSLYEKMPLSVDEEGRKTAFSLWLFRLYSMVCFAHPWHAGFSRLYFMLSSESLSFLFATAYDVHSILRKFLEDIPSYKKRRELCTSFASALLVNESPILGLKDVKIKDWINTSRSFFSENILEEESIAKLKNTDIYKKLLPHEKDVLEKIALLYIRLLTDFYIVPEDTPTMAFFGEGVTEPLLLPQKVEGDIALAMLQKGMVFPHWLLQKRGVESVLPVLIGKTGDVAIKKDLIFAVSQVYPFLVNTEEGRDFLLRLDDFLVETYDFPSDPPFFIFDESSGSFVWNI